MKKRLLACLLTAAMQVSLFPLPALAAAQGGEPGLPDTLTAWE